MLPPRPPHPFPSVFLPGEETGARGDHAPKDKRSVYSLFDLFVEIICKIHVVAFQL